jgi:hypothetical protein
MRDHLDNVMAVLAHVGLIAVVICTLLGMCCLAYYGLEARGQGTLVPSFQPFWKRLAKAAIIGWLSSLAYFLVVFFTGLLMERHGLIR